MPQYLSFWWIFAVQILTINHNIRGLSRERLAVYIGDFEKIALDRNYIRPYNLILLSSNYNMSLDRWFNKVYPSRGAWVSVGRQTGGRSSARDLQIVDSNDDDISSDQDIVSAGNVTSCGISLRCRSSIRHFADGTSSLGTQDGAVIKDMTSPGEPADGAVTDDKTSRPRWLFRRRGCSLSVTARVTIVQ